ncbi:hypothetical protein M426DRAFT_73420 [Hypoxylon sp. CI-4A]|nr:hypothetical protein M426DRAFT_73420 [Hypoxylon sp. CI-4A]
MTVKTPNDSVVPSGSLILVTGPDSYIGGHIVAQLLERGYRARGAVLSISKDKWLYETFKEAHGEGKFELVEVPNMMVSNCFDEAIKGASGLIHVASPVFTSADPDVMVPIAVESTLRCLESAVKEPRIKRVVLTASGGDMVTNVPNKVQFISPDLWNDETVEKAYAPGPHEETMDRLKEVYYASKTLGEKAAWKFMKDNNPSFTFNAVLPCVVYGAPVDPARQGYRIASHWIQSAFELGDAAPKYEGRYYDPQWYVDVRDNAALHIAALEYPDVVGERLPAYAGRWDWNEILGILRRTYPGYNFGTDVTGMGQDMGTVVNERAEELLKRLTGHGWISLEDCIRDNAKWLGEQRGLKAVV